MKSRYIFKYLFLALVLQIFSYMIFPSYAKANTFSPHDICSKSDLKTMYGYSDKFCFDYYLESERFMLAANHLRKILNSHNFSHNTSAYNELYSYINKVERFCNSYSRILNSWNSQNIANGARDISSLFNNNYNFDVGMRNLSQSLKYKEAHKKFLHHCGNK